MAAIPFLISRFGGYLSLLVAGSVLLLFALAFFPGSAEAVLVFSTLRPYLLGAAPVLSLGTLTAFLFLRPWHNRPPDTVIFQALFAALAFAVWCFALAVT